MSCCARGQMGYRIHQGLVEPEERELARTMWREVDVWPEVGRDRGMKRGRDEKEELVVG